MFKKVNTPIPWFLWLLLGSNIAPELILTVGNFLGHSQQAELWRIFLFRNFAFWPGLLAGMPENYPSQWIMMFFPMGLSILVSGI